MIERKIKVLGDVTLNTRFETHFLVKDEVKKVKFRNQAVFEGLLRLGTFIEADRDEEEIKPIPVVLPEVDEDTIVEIDNTIPEEPATLVEEEEQELPPIEAIQDPVELDEAGELAGKEPPEDLRCDEPPQVEEEIDYRDTTETRPTDTPDAPDESEELIPEEETEGLVEVEEIPIEEQDESMPKLSPDDASWQEGTPEFEGKAERTDEEHLQNVIE